MIVRELYESIMLLEYSRAAMIRQYGLKLVHKKGALDSSQEHAPDVVATVAGAILSALLEPNDPTEDKQFSEWIVVTYLRGNESDLPAQLAVKLRQRLGKFALLKKQYRHLLPDANINSYKTFDQFIQAMDSVVIPEKVVKNKGKSKEIYRDETVRVIVPKNEDAAVYYGQGTHWCTAWVPPRTNRFKDYPYPLYVLLPTQAKYAGEKYQLYFDKDRPSKNEYMNEYNTPVDARRLLTVRFPGLLDNVFSAFENVIVGAKDPEDLDENWMNFENLDDETVINLMTSIQAYMKPYIDQYLEAWSENDTDYMEYLDHEADEYGEHDYSQVQSYLEYNPEAKDWLDTVHSLFNFKTVNQFRNMVSEFNMFNDVFSVTELPEVFFQNLEDRISDLQENGTDKYTTIFEAIEDMRIERVNNVWNVTNLG